jgi:hypothetical protein
MSFADPRSQRQPPGRTEMPSSAGRRPDAAGAFRRRLARSETPAPVVERPRGKPYRRSVDWEHVGLVGAGLLIGALVGAGAALLLAPQSGEETRLAIGRQARHARSRARNAWDDLAYELAGVARRGRRRARRAITHARWRASDAMS